MERRLAAVLAADIVGYSRLVGIDEVGTLLAVKALREELIQPRVKKLHGRIVKLMGDGTLIEFPSAVDAVTFAVEVQCTVADRNKEVPEDRRLVYRIGINVGDIVAEDGDIFGEVVNIAARLETLAEPGGIFISDDAHRQIRDKLDLSFQNVGELELKNIARPINVWKWTEGLVRASQTGVLLELSRKPSIAVLPFENMSGDADQEFLADGMTEDLITALSKIRWFLVIARTSSFAYKGKTANVSRVAVELGVRYVLEGSVRRAGNRVRITAQLIDTSTDGHVWAEHYDRDIKDIFALQDEMTQTIASAVDSEIGLLEQDRASKKAPENLGIWEIYQRGLWHLWRFNPPDVEESIRLFERASELDRTFAPAYAYLAYAHFVNVIQGYVEAKPENIKIAFLSAKRAVQLDSRDAIAHFALGRIYTLRGELDEAISALNEAVTLNPNLAQAYHGLGWALELSGELDEAIEALSIAIKLSPRDPRVWATMAFMSLAYLLKRDFQSAAEWAVKAKRVPNDTGYWSSATLAAAQANMGEIEAARTTIREAIERKPDLSLSYLKKTLLFSDQAILAPYLDGLRTAGIPN